METAAVLPCPVKIKIYYFFFFSLKSLPWAHFCGGVLLPQQRPLSSSASPFKCLGWRKSDVIAWNFITRPTPPPFFRRLSHVAKHNFAIYLKKICPVCVVCRALKYSCRHHRYGHDQEIHQKIICGWKSDIFKDTNSWKPDTALRLQGNLTQTTRNNTTTWQKEVGWVYGAKTGLEALNSYFSEGDLRLKCKSGLVYVELKHARTLYNTACVY